MGDWRFYQQQAAHCFVLMERTTTPRAREVFLRLAWHWRQIARAARDAELARLQPDGGAPCIPASPGRELPQGHLSR